MPESFSGSVVWWWGLMGLGLQLFTLVVVHYHNMSVQVATVKSIS